MRNMTLHTLIYIIAISFYANSVLASNFDSSLLNLQHKWAETNYNTDKKVKKSGFINLLETSKKLTQENPNSAEAWIWHGIVQSSYAGVKGGLGALSLIDDAKYAFEKAITIDENALLGSAHTSLGILYLKVPGWPISFGDEDESEKHLKVAMKMNPKGIDVNYFLGEYYAEQENYSKAKEHLLLAQTAPKRVNREQADKYRQQEITTLLNSISKELKE